MFLNFLFHKKREMLPLPYKRELHCHIIPGVDDGSPEMRFSLEYMKALHEFGVERVIFTPHHTEPSYMNTPQRIHPLFQDLKIQCAQEEIPIECEDFSFEYRLDESFINMMNAGKWGEESCKLRPLKDRYILIENSFQQPLLNLDDVIYKLQDKGWYLIMAHPERYHYYSSRGLKSYEHLLDLGVELQCNILSFSGYYGESTQKMAYRLLDEGMISFIGSDLHNLHHVELIRKYLRSKDYAEIRPDLVSMIQNDKI
jgi:tyrosine-protein phosphatase YwqE